MVKYLLTTNGLLTHLQFCTIYRYFYSNYSYERACKLLEELELANDEEEQKQSHLLLKFYNNR